MRVEGEDKEHRLLALHSLREGGHVRDGGRAVDSDPFHHFKEALLLPMGEAGYLHFLRISLAAMWTVDQRGHGPAWLLRECGRREQVNGPAKEAQQGQMGTVEVGRAKTDLMKSELHWVTGSQG